MTSMTEIGDELRDHVIELLEARGFPVKREVRLNTKKIDAIVELEDELVRQTMAIECKNYDRNLRQSEVAQIYTEYHSLFTQKAIDGIWIIVRQDFSADARNWAAGQPGLHLFTIAEFEERQFGFSRYVRQLMEMFNEQDLHQYYVQQRISETEQLNSHVLNWIDGDDPRPIAVLGGYGMGKTSFCKYLVSTLGERYLADRSQRVPIYVRLSEIAKEQELDGLLGKMLASRYRLNNYNFQDIMNLNKRGKFVFIFDGFDEMKHALTWDLFRYNFQQINRTVHGRSRVIIAGRPNAFLSDMEHSWALRGTRIAGERMIRMPDWPEYEEITLQPFSDAEAREFLRRYLESQLSSDASSTPEADAVWIQSRISEFEALSRRNDFARPVHLRIFAELAKRRDLVLKNFSVFDLYEEATHATLGREMEKPERLGISGDNRSKFIQEVAWWLWEKDNGRSLHFNPFAVPTSIIRRVLTAEQQAADDALLRELFSGAFLERKFGDNFYFAHRSFLEFFVAKKLLESSSTGIALASAVRMTLGVINSSINQEVLEFLKSSGKFASFADFVIDSMNRYAGELKLILLVALAEQLSDKDRSSIKSQQHIELLFKVLPLYEAKGDGEDIKVFASLIDSDLRSKEVGRAQTAFYFIVEAILFNLKSPLFGRLIAGVVNFLVNEVDYKYWRRGQFEPTMPKLRLSRENIFEYVFLKSAFVAAEMDSNRQPVLRVDFGRALNEMNETRRPKITITNRSTPVEPETYVWSVPVHELNLPDADQKTLIERLKIR